jgi:uncharacterized membrane protein
MILSDHGEARVRGYLFVLERSLRASLPPAIATDAAREVESHIRDRVAETDALPDERAAVERVLAALGTPTRVARGYSLELSMEEAVVTGRLSSMMRVLWLIASTTTGGFFMAIGLFIGYMTGAAFAILALLKPIFPANVGLVMRSGIPTGFGFLTNLPPGTEVVGGYWLIPVMLAIGLAILVGTHKGARAWLRWFQKRRAGWRV